MRRRSCAAVLIVVAVAGALLLHSCVSDTDDPRAEDCRKTRTLRSLAINSVTTIASPEEVRNQLTVLHGGEDLHDADVQQAVFNIGDALDADDAPAMVDAGLDLAKACEAE
ncbi:hypothetical protein [Streptomyces sp. NPDC050738]|uniref:hypothetical protein n=1 Tax=Streptomyces sp. NPDC050738 TaxID=3154744 RepID=UPI00343F75EE